MDKSTAIKNWTNATAGLPWAQQRWIQDTLNLVQSGDIKIVYGANDYQGYPCLINALGSTIKAVNDSPTEISSQTVIAFDVVCRAFQGETYGFVDSLTAEFLVRHFGALKPIPAPEFEELPESGISWADVPDQINFDVQG